MSVKDDAIAALHGALTAVEGETAKIGADLATAKAVVDTQGRALLQSQALKDALMLAHATLSGATAVAPVAANAVGAVKKWALPVGASGAALAAYAHWGLKLF